MLWGGEFPEVCGAFDRDGAGVAVGEVFGEALREVWVVVRGGGRGDLGVGVGHAGEGVDVAGEGGGLFEDLIRVHGGGLFALDYGVHDHDVGATVAGVETDGVANPDLLCAEEDAFVVGLSYARLGVDGIALPEESVC